MRDEGINVVPEKENPENGMETIPTEVINENLPKLMADITPEL